MRFIIFFCLVNINLVRAQCQFHVNQGMKLLGPFKVEHNSYYRSELFNHEITKLPFIFHFDKVYRIIPCGVSETGDRIVFTIHDKLGVPVYSSLKHEAAAFYDFAVGVSSKYTITAKFENGAGCAAFIFGVMEKDLAYKTPNLKIIELSF